MLGYSLVSRSVPGALALNCRLRANAFIEQWSEPPSDIGPVKRACRHLAEYSPVRQLELGLASSR